MSDVALCTDSSALFPAEVEERLDLIVVPVAVVLDGHRYDERNGSLDDFYARLARGAKATTSQPSPGELLDAYARAAAAGAEAVISLHLDARISGTVAAAELAAREAPIAVTVVDTSTASFGVGLCVRATADALAGGASTAEAVDVARALGRTLRNVFVAQAGPPGRIPETKGWSLLELADGTVEAHAAYAAMDEALEAMAARVLAEPGPLAAAVGHAAASTGPAADALALALEGQAHVTRVERYRVGAAVGAHTGGLSFGAFWWPSP
jgi:DegV family protein with EDD domain